MKRYYVVFVFILFFNLSSVAQVYNSLVLDSSNQPHVCFKQAENLKYASFDGSTWNVQDTVTLLAGRYPRFPSLQLTTNDLPCISYGDYKNADDCSLKYATYSGGTWNSQLVNSSAGSGEYGTSLVLDSLDRPHIAYHVHRGGYKGTYSRYTGSSWVTEPFNTSSGYYCNLVLDANNKPHIAYFNNALCYSEKTGTSWQKTTVQVGGYSAFGGIKIRLHPDTGRPVIGTHAHSSGTSGSAGTLKMATYDGNNWLVTNLLAVASDSGSRGQLGFELTTNGSPQFVYYDRDVEAARFGSDGGSEWDFSDAAASCYGYIDMTRAPNDDLLVVYYDRLTYGVSLVRYNGTEWSAPEIVWAPFRIISRQTKDLDSDGFIDAVLIELTYPVNDDFSGLTILVGGYIITGFDTEIPDDNRFLILLEESESPDTSMIPSVQITTNSSLRSTHSLELLGTDDSPVVTQDDANPILMEMEFQGSHFVITVSEPVQHLFRTTNLIDIAWDELFPVPASTSCIDTSPPPHNAFYKVTTDE